ncbi:Pyruvate formate-lyase 1-activating enzyme [bioreactor metagenome]|uniref:Pyruvate formate-lyase 1-activating enzyme n=1 Tax=bioreactor metagenome TaxID=1076179 RepID=A0A645FQH2_9ZZZZ
MFKIHSFESLAALDGPGIRFAIFFHGCPLRCAYCHNPETWYCDSEYTLSEEELFNKIKRYVPYFGKNGGVKFSGGEPLLYAKELCPFMDRLQTENIHIALDTAGSIMNEDVKELLKKKPLVLLDIKMPDKERYDSYIGGSLTDTLLFLDYADKYGCDIWIRYVVVPTINDSIEDIDKIIKYVKDKPNVKKLTLLPYHTLGVGKYEKLQLEYRLKDIEVPSKEKMTQLEDYVKVHFR